MIKAHLIVKGDVQGVGFRAWIQFQARQLGLVGWVKNLNDGSVEAVIEGDEELVNELVNACREGPRFAEVKEHAAEFSDALEGFKTFEVLR